MHYITLLDPSTLLRPLARPLVACTDAPMATWLGRQWGLHRRRVAAPMGRYLRTLHEVAYAGQATASDWVDWYADDDIFNNCVDNLIRLPKGEVAQRRGGSLVWSVVIKRWTVWRGRVLLAAVSLEREAQEVLEEAESVMKENERTANLVASNILK